MNKKFIIGIIFLLFTITAVFAEGSTTAINGKIIKNKFFSITLPSDVSGTYSAEVKKDKISIFDKESKNSGFGGFAFGIGIYKNPADHAMLPGGIKIGELVDKKNCIYDVVLKYPTDVQYDYTKGPKAPENYKKLYSLGSIADINGVKGAVFHRNQGMKGEDLYKDVLQKHITAIKEKWDSTKLEKENMSYMYNVLAHSNTNLLNKVGYAYYDMNGDGIDELAIGEIADGAWKGVIYDIYTMVNRKPEHVISGGNRDRYYICDDFFICNEYSASASESGIRVYILQENSTKLYPQVSFKHDESKDNPWFLSYGSDIKGDKWEIVSEYTFNDRKRVFNKYERFNYIPLADFK